MSLRSTRSDTLRSLITLTKVVDRQEAHRTDSVGQGQADGAELPLLQKVIRTGIRINFHIAVITMLLQIVQLAKEIPSNHN